VIMNLSNLNEEEYIEAEVVDTSLSSETDESKQYHSPRNSKKGCYLIIGCLFIFLIGLITVLGGILKFISRIINGIFG